MGDYAIVEWGYNKVYDDELALTEGDLVRITHRKNEAGEEGWWQGTKEDGSKGCFPYNYVRPATAEEIRPISMPGGVELASHTPLAGPAPAPSGTSGSDPPAKEVSIAITVKSPPVNSGSAGAVGSSLSTSTGTSTPAFLQRDGGARSVKDLKNILGNTIADGLSKALKDSGSSGRVTPPKIISSTASAADVSPMQMKGHVKGKRSLSESSVQSALLALHGGGGTGTVSEGEGEATEIKMKTERSQSMTGTMKRKSKALPVAPGSQPTVPVPSSDPLHPPLSPTTLKSIPEGALLNMGLQSSPTAASGGDDLISATVTSTAPASHGPADTTPAVSPSVSVTVSPREAITSLSSDVARAIIASDISVDNAPDAIGSPKGKPNTTFRKQLNKLLFVERMIKSSKEGRKEEDLSSLILSPTTSVVAEASLAESDKTPSPMSPQSPEDLKANKARENEKMRKSRTFVIQEILDTEKSFIDSLESVIERYYNPLLYTSSPGVVKLLSVGDVAILFNSWKAMIAVNTLLLSKMQSRVQAAKDDIVPLGDIFCDYTPLFSIYGTYASKHDSVLGEIHEMRLSDPAVGVLLDKCDASDKVDLTSLMIKPIQRVPRYILLLKDLQRNTPSDHPEFEQIQKALVLLGAMAVHINESVRDAERHEEMLEVNQSFQADGLNFMAPFRYLIHQGSITLVSSSSQKKYSMFLFSDILVVTNPLSSGYKFVGAIDVEGIAVDDIPNVVSLGLKHTFQIIGTNKCFLAVAADGEEKKHWLDAFMKVHPLCRTQSSFHQRKHEMLLYKYRPTIINYRDDAPALGVERRTTCDICDKPFTESQLKYRCFVTKNLVHDACSTVCSRSATSSSVGMQQYRISIRSMPREESEVNIDDEIKYTKRKLVQLDKELKGARSLNLGTKPRKFIREGPILRVSKQSGPQLLHFTLLSDLIIYSSTDNGVASTIYIGQIPLYSLDIDESVHYGDGVYAFSLSFSGKVSMTLVFTDVLVRDSWLFDIQTTTQELLDSTGAPSKSPRKPRTKSMAPMESFRNIRQASVNSFSPMMSSDRSLGDKSLESGSPKIALTLPLSVLCPVPARRSSVSSSVSVSSSIVSPSAGGGSSRPVSLAASKSDRGEGGWKDTLKGMTSVFVKAKERRKSEHVEESLDRSLERRPSREMLMDRHILTDAPGL